MESLWKTPIEHLKFNFIIIIINTVTSQTIIIVSWFSSNALCASVEFVLFDTKQTSTKRTHGSLHRQSKMYQQRIIFVRTCDEIKKKNNNCD